MNETIDRNGALTVPDETDSELAATASRELARARKASISVRLDDGTDLQLPKAVTPLLIKTQEAANLMNISRPYLNKLLDRGDIPHHKVGTHRRIRFEDLERFRGRREVERRKALEELAAQAQELGAGY